MSRPRTALLTAAALAAVAHVGLSVAVEAARPDWRDPAYGGRLRLLRERLRAEPGRPLMVLLGSSRTLMGVRPDLLDRPSGRVREGEAPAEPNPPDGPSLWSGGPHVRADAAGSAGASPSRKNPELVFNFALPGSGPLHELVCLRRLLADGVHPTAVLAEVLTPELLRAGTAEQWFDGGRLDRRDLRTLRPYCGDSSALRERWLAAKVQPWPAVRAAVFSRYAPDWLPWSARQDHLWATTDRTGWMRWPEETLTPERRAAWLARTHAEYAPLLAGTAVAPVQEQALRELVGLCRRRGIGVALHLMPETPQFRGWYASAGLAAVNDRLAAVSRELAVPLLDARDWGGPDENFTDGHHLLPEAAEAFSGRFGREWLRLTLGGEGR